LLWLACRPVAIASPPVTPIDFNRDVRPILAKSCFPCHGSDEKKRGAGLRLDQRDSATRPRKDSPAVIVPGKADASEVIHRITSEDETERMPPPETAGKLTPGQIDMLRRWINQGAVYAKHWSFVKPARPVLPKVGTPGWVRNPIDQIVLARLEKVGLKPSPEADRYQLLRRVSLDLRGLPPSPEEIHAFEQDHSPDAYEKLVDRFLADPAYGERWARVWLDLARYADSAGYGSDPLRPQMWRYRDWVINAFNRNLPYDQFTIDQLAGDLLPHPTLDQRVATAFHRNTMTNTEGGTDDEEFRVAAVKDRANTTLQVWMGLTLGCAQCHSHKYDPITQQDYYRFYAVFNQTADNDQPNETPTMPAPTAGQEARNRRIDGEVAALRKKTEQPTFELLAAQWAWEESLRPSNRWTVLRPETVRSEQGTAAAVSVEGNITTGPLKSTTDTYTITTRVPLKQITGLRLETQATPRLRWFGRQSAKGVGVVRLTASLRPADQSFTRGRFVRVELPGENRLLSLAEVQVFDGSDNVARGAEASQSSTDFHGDAARALDGNTDGDFFRSRSVTHTRTETNPWWEVRLPAETTIDRIVLWNRTGGVEDRLSGAKVKILNNRREIVWEQSLRDVPSPSLALFLDGASMDFKQKRAELHDQRAEAALVKLLPRRANETGLVAIPTAGTAAAQFLLGRPTMLTGDEVVLSMRIETAFGESRPGSLQFRLGVTDDSKLPLRAVVPERPLSILDTPEEKRSPQQVDELARYFRSIAPGNQPLRDTIVRLEQSRPKIADLPVMVELTKDRKRVTKLMYKGNFLTPGDAVEPRLPAAFTLDSGDKTVTRLDVARWLMHPENPLTARVAVNRLWAQLFGTGLVETEEDFGTQGDAPSHPELLDWLATEYQQTLKWDTKAMLKRIVTSATYRQSSRVTPELLERDPRNRLMSRGPRYRLEAEMVRDQALALSGLLTHKVGGPSVYPPQPDGLWQAAFNGERTWATSRGDDRYRRGLYTFWRRTIPYPSMAAFDAPSRELCQVKRVRSNTPVQAFVTLNDPVYLEAAQALARRIVWEGGTNLEDRVSYALRLCTCRPPEARQVETLVRLYQHELEKYRRVSVNAEKLATQPLGPLPKGSNTAELAAWTVVANVLLNLDGVLTKG